MTMKGLKRKVTAADTVGCTDRGHSSEARSEVVALATSQNRG